MESQYCFYEIFHCKNLARVMHIDKGYLSCKNWRNKNGKIGKIVIVQNSFVPIGHNYRESYSVDSDMSHKETSTLLVQPRQLELKTGTLWTRFHADIFIRSTVWNENIFWNLCFFFQLSAQSAWTMESTQNIAILRCLKNRYALP